VAVADQAETPLQPLGVVVGPEEVVVVVPVPPLMLLRMLSHLLLGYLEWFFIKKRNVRQLQKGHT
jgi:hypothetical protein